MTDFRLLIDMEQVRLELPSGRAWLGETDLSALDGIIIKKIGSRYSPNLLDRLEILRFLENRGLRIFSSPWRIMRVLDRLSCTVTLQLAGIPMPPTTITENVDEAVAVVKQYGKAVFKPLYTSKARGMIVMSREDDVRSAVEVYRDENPIMYIQKTIELEGKDLGIAFLGGKYLATYARCKQNDSWNTSTASGAKYASFEPSDDIINLAQKAQALFDLDFTCVDVALTQDGPYVFEVSAFGGFRGIRETSAIDPSERYAAYVMDELNG
jgi:ribosomal protein S6--L-glutamate ligase